MHHLSAVTSICPQVDCAALRHIWAGTYGQRVCHVGASYAAYAVVAFHLSHLLHLPHFVSSPYSLFPHVFATSQLSPFSSTDHMDNGHVSSESVWSQSTHIDEPRPGEFTPGPMTTSAPARCFLDGPWSGILHVLSLRNRRSTGLTFYTNVCTWCSSKATAQESDQSDFFLFLHSRVKTSSKCLALRCRCTEHDFFEPPKKMSMTFTLHFLKKSPISLDF